MQVDLACETKFMTGGAGMLLPMHVQNPSA